MSSLKREKEKNPDVVLEVICIEDTTRLTLAQYGVNYSPGASYLAAVITVHIFLCWVMHVEEMLAVLAVSYHPDWDAAARSRI